MATASSLGTIASDSRAPVLVRSRNFQWYWSSGADLWYGKKQWERYIDVENEIIEDALNAKRFDIEIDGDYVINLKHEVQYKKRKTEKQRRIKRVQLSEDRGNAHFREERFSLPVIDSPSMSSIVPERADDCDTLELLKAGKFVGAYYFQEVKNKNKTHADIVEEAAQRIVKEGTALHKEHEAQWLAQQLRDVKYFGSNVEASICRNIPSQIGETCVYLYTKESFWYKLLNHILREHKTAILEQLITLGPFCYLPFWYMNRNATTDVKIVYRGFTLTDEPISFASFALTTRNREKAEQFGDTLLIMDSNVRTSWGAYVCCSADISRLSDF